MQPTLTVVDLTASVGLRALQGVTSVSASEASHRPVDLPGFGGRARLDWLRPSDEGHLHGAQPGCIGVFLLVGPGSSRLLERAFAFARELAAPERWALLTPNAVMEERRLVELDRAAQDAGEPGSRTLQLPRSSPDYLWLVLLEQCESLLLRHFESLSQRGEAPPEMMTMSATLNQSLDAAMAIEGALAVSLVDYRSGMSLGARGSGLNLDLAAAGNSEVVRAKLRTAESLGIRGSIEDILITLTQQYHLIRLMPGNPGLFLYLVLDKQRGNLALARYKLTEIERALRV